MTTAVAEWADTCPSWCVTEHGVLQGEDDRLHSGAGLRLAHGVTAHLCTSVDPGTGEVDGPYVVVGAEEWSLARTRSVGHALIALAGQAGEVRR